MNDVDPQAWLAHVLASIAQYPASRLDELLPGRFLSSATYNPGRRRKRPIRSTPKVATSAMHVVVLTICVEKNNGTCVRALFPLFGVDDVSHPITDL